MARQTAPKAKKKGKAKAVVKAKPKRKKKPCLEDAVRAHLEKYFKAHTHSFPASGLYDRVLVEVERPLLELTLEATEGNQLQAARILGINRNTLRKKLQELGLYED
ncbi:MAG: hypothetical protein J0L97_07490 [Alphaproteobacteria bacterium]|nr:hypothetical protein [Alphaproteobacteria bacterium]